MTLHSFYPEYTILGIAVYNMQFDIGTLRALIAVCELFELALGKHPSLGDKPHCTGVVCLHVLRTHPNRRLYIFVNPVSMKYSGVEGMDEEWRNQKTGLVELGLI